MITRRAVLGLMSLGTLTAAVGMWLGAALRAVAGRARGRQRLVSFSRLPAPGQAVVKGQVGLCRDEKGYFAVLLVCPHLGCTPRLARGRWMCPCHGSSFSFTGERLHGPAPRGLVHLHLRGNAKALVVDTSREVPTAWRLKT